MISAGQSASGAVLGWDHAWTMPEPWVGNAFADRATEDGRSAAPNAGADLSLRLAHDTAALRVFALSVPLLFY
jgi:hypothetical protein